MPTMKLHFEKMKCNVFFTRGGETSDSTPSGDASARETMAVKKFKRIEQIYSLESVLA